MLWFWPMFICKCTTEEKSGKTMSNDHEITSSICCMWKWVGIICTDVLLHEIKYIGKDYFRYGGKEIENEEKK